VGRAECPAWCRTDHARLDPQTVFVTEDGFTLSHERHHSRELLNAPNPGAGRSERVYVAVAQLDDLDAGRRLAPVVNVDGAECMDAATARAVAAAVLAAAGLLAGRPAPAGRVRRCAPRLRSSG
jgi:hypothetical protein